MQVIPIATTTYTLTGTGPDGTTTATGTITVTVNDPVPPAPVVESFVATPAGITLGQPATLTWTTTDAVSVSIDGVPMPLVDDSMTLIPATTTTYTLTATDGAWSFIGRSFEPDTFPLQ